MASSGERTATRQADPLASDSAPSIFSSCGTKSLELRVEQRVIGRGYCCLYVVVV